MAKGNGLARTRQSYEHLQTVAAHRHGGLDWGESGVENDGPSVVDHTESTAVVHTEDENEAAAAAEAACAYDLLEEPFVVAMELAPCLVGRRSDCGSFAAGTLPGYSFLHSCQVHRHDFGSIGLG